MSYKINKYPDRASYVSIPKEWEDTYQEVTFRINTYTDFVHLLQLCEVMVYNRMTAHIIIPHLLDSQADKRFNEFHSSGLKVLIMALNKYSEQGISFGIFHPHNPEVTEALFHSIEIVDNSEYILKVLRELSLEGPSMEDNLILMSADAGGMKPLGKLATKLDWKGTVMNCSKVRESGTVSRQQAPMEDFGGKDILIVDDLFVYGGTFKGLAIMLREKNCGKLYLACSHGTVQNLGEDPLTNYFDKVFVTNSKYNEYKVDVTKIDTEEESWRRPQNLTIIKMFEDGV